MSATFTERLDAFKQEFPPMLQLACPLVLAELGWIGMGIVDTMMVGRVSAAAIGGVSIASVLFYTVGIFGSGLLLGLDTLVSQAFGAGNLDDCHHSLLTSVYLCLVLAPLLMWLVGLVAPLLRSIGIHAAVLHEAIPYLRALNWSMLPLLLYFALRRYLQAMNLVKPVTFALLTANVVNLAADWALIYGHLGAPPMGAVGSGWATTIARIYMASILLGYILHYDRRHGIGLLKRPLQPDLVRARRLLGLGLPAALQFSLEGGVFATATALIGKLGPAASAGHQIALVVVTTTYMVPLGFASAAAVRVGQALGRHESRAASRAASRAGWTALLLGAGFMACAALALLLAPRHIARLFTADRAVITTCASLLAVAAFFQLFDGVQAVATGALRGAGDTRTPMLCHLLAYWLVGLPLGYFLCFTWGWGAVGLWAGLSTALILIGIVLLHAWRRKVREFSVLPVYS